MTKKILIITLIMILILPFSIAQKWTENLPQNKEQKDLKLQDYKNAFEEYWAPYSVKNGYYIQNGEKKKAPGWKQFYRWYYDNEGQVNPADGSFPEKTAQQVYDEYKQNNTNDRGVQSANWTVLGPSYSEGGYAGVGRINTVAFHPSNNNTWWIGAPAGGLWMTTNNGNSWTCLTDDNNVLGVSDIAIPSDYASSQTIYIATGDRDAWDNRSIGVLKSTNGGATWNTTGIQFSLADNEMVTRLLIDPNDDETIIAATTSGVYKTTNAGANWSNQLTSLSFIDMEYKPGNFNTLYGSTTNGEIWISTDGGNNWSKTLDQGNRIELAVTPDNSSYVYAVVANSSSGLHGVYRSTNSGASFSMVFSGSTTNLLDWSSSGSGSGGQGWYDLAIAASPNDANTLLVGGINTWRSTNGGSSWSIVNHWWGDGVPAVHADKHMLKYRSNGDLFECNDGGVYLSTNNGSSWTDKTDGMEISQIYKLGVSQTVANETIIGLQDNGTKLLSGGLWDDVKGGDGMECLIDYTDVNTQYGTYVNGQISRTTNHWGSSVDIEPSAAGSGAWVTPYIISPSDHSTLYAGYSDVWKTTNKGNSWSKISTMNTGSKIRAMAIAPSNSQVLFVSDPDQIWKTTNDGGSWTDVTNNLPTGSSSITYIAIKADDPNTVWVTLSGYNSNNVYVSTNGGTSWTNISAGLPQLPAYTIVQNSQITSATHLYVGTELGVYFKNGINNWVEYNDGLPNVKCGELEIYYAANSANSKLRLASYGRGLWETGMEQENTDLPTVQTATPSDITATTATLGGNVTDIGSSGLTERGVVWSTSPNPTTSDDKIVDDGTGTGSYTAEANGLNPATTYYTRAYAINSSGTAYGGQETFTTNCNTFSIPFSEDFEGTDFPPNCWVTFRGPDNVGSANDWESTTDAQSGGKAAYVEYEDVTGTAEDWLVSPLISLTTGSQLSFYQKQTYTEFYGSGYYVLVSTASQTDHDDFIIVESWGEDDLTTDYTEKVIDLSAYDGEEVYIAFAMANDNGDDWFVDNINVTGTSSPTPIATVSASPGCNTGSITVFSDLSGVQTFYLTDNGGTVLDDATVDATSYVFTGITDGTYRGKVERNGQMSDLSSAVTLTNLSAPDQPSAISGATAPCEGDTETYSVTNDTEVTTYTWTLPSGWSGSSSSNSITVTIGSASGDITVTPSNDCGDGAARSLSVNVSSIPAQPDAIDGNPQVCEGTQETYTVTNDPEVDSYSWSIPGDWTGSSTTNSITVTVGGNDGNISVTPSNTCGTGPTQTMAVVVSNSGPAQPDPIQGDFTVCEGGNETYSVPEDVAVDSYEWTLPAGWTGSSTTNSITVSVGTNGGEISVVPSNQCGTGPAQTATVAVSSDAPAQPDPISGSTEVCESATEIYAVNLEADVDYTWLLPSGWTGSSITNEISVTVGNTSGDITVIPANGCGAGPSQSLFVIVDNIPDQPDEVIGEVNPCVGSEETYTVSNQDNTIFNWTLPSGWTGSSTSNTITVTVGSSEGEISVAASNDCGESLSSTLEVDPIEVLGNLGTISGPSQVMETELASFSVNNATDAVSYIWTLESIWEIQGEEESNEVSILFPLNSESGTLIVKAVNECGESNESEKYIEIIPLAISEVELGKIDIYPNPAQNVLNIELENILTKDAKLLLYDFNGKQVLVEKIKAGTQIHQLKLESYSSGSYIIEIQTNFNSYKFKVVIQ